MDKIGGAGSACGGGTKFPERDRVLGTTSESQSRGCDVEYMGEFFDWLGRKGYLQVLKGVIIGKMCTADSFEPYAERIRQIVSGKYGLTDLPILYGVNFGHASPICILPYGAEVRLDIEQRRFTMIDSGVSNLPI